MKAIKDINNGSVLSEQSNRKIVSKRTVNQTFTKLSDCLMTGRMVSSKELGPNKDLKKKSIVLVP